MIAFRAPSSARGKGTLTPSVTFDACKLFILSKKKRNMQEIKKMKKFWKNSQEKVIEIRSLIKTFYLMFDLN